MASTAPAASGGPKPNKPSSVVSASSIFANTERATHVLKIEGYARTKAMPTGKPLESSRFKAGGYYWRIQYYPNGYEKDMADYISLYLFLDEDVEDPVMVQFVISFADQEEEGREAPESAPLLGYGSNNAYGYSRFVRRSELEESKHLRDDAFTIQCDMIFVKFLADRVSTDSVPELPSNLEQHLRDLLETGNGADVVFQVGEETLAAHRWMLAVRSSVFKAELCGEMKESSTGVVRVDDMEAEVFKALLFFIYTDTLPKMNVQEEYVMSQHLLVASDRYDLERLKSMCERNLCNHIGEANVMFILELAEQHHCHGLKNACFEFLSIPARLEVALQTDSFKHMSRNYPSIIMELIAKLGTQLRYDETHGRRKKSRWH